MWDTAQDTQETDSQTHLSHDMLCPHCGHAMHTYLSCDHGCDCEPTVMPGASHLLAG
jgi:hypothetical protein